MLLAKNEGGSAHEIIATRLADQEWAAEAVERGFKAMMEAHVPESRQCIAALVAAYLAKFTAPDRQFRRVANFLIDATAETLVAAKRLCTDVAVSAQRYQPGGVIVAMTTGGLRHIYVRGKNQVFQGKDAGTLTLLGDEQVVRDLLQMLTRHGFAQDAEHSISTVGAVGRLVDVADQIVLEPGEPLASISLLGTCLSVISDE
jgi:hypothetical protein